MIPESSPQRNESRPTELPSLGDALEAKPTQAKSSSSQSDWLAPRMQKPSTIRGFSQ